MRAYKVDPGTKMMAINFLKSCSSYSYVFHFFFFFLPFFFPFLPSAPSSSGEMAAVIAFLLAASPEM